MSGDLVKVEGQLSSNAEQTLEALAQRAAVVENEAAEKVKALEQQLGEAIARSAQYEAEVAQGHAAYAALKQETSEAIAEANTKVADAERGLDVSDRKLAVLSGQVNILRSEAEKYREAQAKLKQEQRANLAEATLKPWL